MSRSTVRVSGQLRDQLRGVANERGLTYDELLREMLDVYHSLAQRDAERRERLGRVNEAPNSGS